MSTPTPVAPWRIAVAKDHGIVHVEQAALACRTVGIPFWAALALIQQESADPARGITGGANIYGHDKGGYFAGHGHVTKANYAEYRHHVIDLGATADGIGPCQITYAGPHNARGGREGGYLTQMEKLGLEPWKPLDNMIFGFGLFWGNYVKHSGESWRISASIYNGGPSWASNPKAVDYGHEVLARVQEWHNVCKIKGPLNPVLP